MMLTEAEALTWLASWDSQGCHRTGTSGDEAGAEWLAGEAEALGARAEIETFAMARLHPIAAEVSFDGMTVTGVAMFDAPDGVVEGRCGPLGSGAEIGIGSTSPLAVYAEEFRAMRRDSPHRALVLATRGGAPGLALLNAESFNVPYGPPILLVDSDHAEALSAAATANRPMRVRLQSERVQSQARNVVVRLAGTDPGRPPLVVMTPRSSWWTSTSERGGGLVCWLAGLRALLATPPGCDVVFTANTGHELGHTGLDAFMAARPGWKSRATWLHWGANIGAAGGTTTVASGHDALRHSMAAALAAKGQAHTLTPDGVMPHGESRDIHRAGGRYITLAGTNPLFHLPQDRLPHAIDLPAVARCAAAAAELAVRHSRERR